MKESSCLEFTDTSNIIEEPTNGSMAQRGEDVRPATEILVGPRHYHSLVVGVGTNGAGGWQDL